MTVYLITNLLNGKQYIGQTISCYKARWQNHCKKGNALHSAIKKYGRKSFRVQVLDTAYTLDELNAKELFWVNEMNCYAPKGYNIAIPGNNRRVAESTKKLMSEKCSGVNNHNYGKKASQETLARLSASLKGKNLGRKLPPISEETRRKKSQSSKKCKVICLNNGVTYESITVAAKTLECNLDAICKVLSGKYKHTRGFRFKRAD